jgi:hypothetical protein
LKENVIIGKLIPARCRPCLEADAEAHARAELAKKEGIIPPLFGPGCLTVEAEAPADIL